MGHDSNMHSLPQDAGKAWKIGNDIHTLGCGAAHIHGLHEALSGHTTCSRPQICIHMINFHILYVDAGC